MKKLLMFVFAMGLVFACDSEDEGGGTSDNFDRKALLENLADNIIIPSYQKFQSDLQQLQIATTAFVDNTDSNNLENLRSTWSNAYISWQSVSMYEVGKAEELSYRNFMNVYPVNTDNIESNIQGDFDLSQVSQQDEQGFAALDYMLFGLGANDQEILGKYTGETVGTTYKAYLNALVARMVTLTNSVVEDWTNEYRDAFVSNSGSSATSSLDKLANDFVFHYEKHLRAGKIGIPAGVFSGDPLEDRVEALYAGNLSKKLLFANLEAMQNLFNGKHFGSAAQGESFKTYLQTLNADKDGSDLDVLINDQFDKARNTASGLGDNFSMQVRNNNNLMLNTYDELQKNVVFLKVDMFQVFNITADYNDTDGD